MALIKEYFELTKKYQDDYGENTILLMQCGAFFEVYGNYNKDTNIIEGSKINEFSQICELSIVEKNVFIGFENQLMMAGFKDFQIEKYLRKIQAAGFTAVVYIQDENIKNTTRSLAGIYSPGTYFNYETPKLTNSITCIWINYIENKIIMKGKFIVIGMANIDIFTGKTTLFQYKEIYINNPTTYDELERFISIYDPSEVILIYNLPNEKDIDNIISYAGISCNLIHKINLNNLNLSKEKLVKNCEKQTYQKEILYKFYKFDNFDIFIQNFYENNIATQSLCYLLDFIYQHTPQLVNKILEPVFENTSKRLILANHSLKQLNIINDGNVKPTKYSCISEMLNYCLTSMGKRKFFYNILNPICDEDTLNIEYNNTEYILNNFELFDKEFKNKLIKIKDLSKFERQIFLKKITPKSFYIIYNNLQTTLDLFNFVKKDNVLIKYLSIFDKNILDIDNICENLINLINNYIDIDISKDIEQFKNFEINFIKKGVDEELDKKTQTLIYSEYGLESVRKYLSSLIENKETKSSKTNELVKIHDTEKNIYKLISTSRRCKILEEALPLKKTEILLKFKIDENIHDLKFLIAKNYFKYEKQSASNNFISDPQINSLCNDMSKTKISMKEQITIVYNNFIEKFCNFQNQLERIINFITIIDVSFTKAFIAKKFNYCKPNIVNAEKAFIDAKGLRHCLIEQFQMNELYVKNDILLGDGIIDGILLYGTNAVGKTTIIRALGVSIILAQSGLYVPCSEFKYKPYKHIFTRIIGNDNIFKGLSTFEVEMSELRTILRLMNENSLIVGDELCSGTETISAISIFVTGIQKFYKSKSSFIFATHLHEIVNYEEILELKTVHLKHMEVIYNKEMDMLVYNRKLKDGSGANMYGLEVCKSLHLPEDFLESANNIRQKYNGFEGKSILSLKQSKYNSDKIINLCEKCSKKPGTEVHHLQHQSDADYAGIISTDDNIFHKNNLANLMTLCEKCHNEIHKKNIKQKFVKTSKGKKLIEIKN